MPFDSSLPEVPFFPHSERRTLSEQLDRPSNAAELQKLHDGQDLARQGVNDKFSSQESRASPISSPATTSAYHELQLEHHLTTGQALSTKTSSISSLRNAVAEDRKKSPEPQLRIPGQSLVDCDLFHPLATESNSASGHHSLGSNDMASGTFRSNDARRPARYENRPPMSQVLCRNGPQCRKLLEGTCNYNHDFGSGASNGLHNASKKSLSVESPAFTPKTRTAVPVKNIGISPKAAGVAPFTPRGSGAATPAAPSHSKEPSLEFYPQHAFQHGGQYQEFVPGQQTFLSSPQLDAQPQMSAFPDTFLSQPGIPVLEASQNHMNPYVQQTASVAAQPYYQDASSFKHPLNYHLYSAIGPRRENLMAYQRSTSDFFIPDNLREDLQRKADAALQTFANSTLPQHVEYFHSLVALDTNNSKGQSAFGYPSWTYKATSSKDGHTYVLRRIEGFRLTSEASIRTITPWKRLHNSSMVTVHDAFTGRWFGDSSLVVVTDFHPNSQTLAEKHLMPGRNAGRAGSQIVPENDIWGYIIQLASALRTIHFANLAAQSVMASKVLLTSKNRVRLNGCGVFDITKYEQQQSVRELQRKDLQDLGRLVLCIAARSPSAHQNTHKSLELVGKCYSDRLRICLAWLLAPPPLPQDAQTQPSAKAAEYNVEVLLTNIADKVVQYFDSALHYEDEVTSNLMGELENGRLVRLLTKLNVILERPDTSVAAGSTSNPALLNQPSAAWSETGERYYLKLFRDFVFHQVDHEGRPVLDLGHIITCLNKLDAGIDEKIQLISRDEQSIFIVSYKEVKRGFEAAWSEITKHADPQRR
ncbi:hypothetical protein AC579_4716 [Pseudocercospora musae]|uniref:PAN2-PAN3 deadenylation complex subunit PAN3 n=1 Tax=Pseudocercospora musae TaxID=113226 RepID=A0A139I2Z7_9PEZI|nr:hypothetical protein AC579_4716 [Pseudocercospora musae]